MRVTGVDIATLTEALRPLDTPDRRDAYRAGKFPRADKVKDLDRRYRWDLLYASRALADDMCAKYDAAHIDTALRCIVPALEA